MKNTFSINEISKTYISIITNNIIRITNIRSKKNKKFTFKICLCQRSMAKSCKITKKET